VLHLVLEAAKYNMNINSSEVKAIFAKHDCMPYRGRATCRHWPTGTIFAFRNKLKDKYVRRQEMSSDYFLVTPDVTPVNKLKNHSADDVIWITLTDIPSFLEYRESTVESY